MRNDIGRAARALLYIGSMKNQIQSFFTITLSIASLFAFVACGKSSDGGGDPAAGGGGTTTVQSTVNAQCNGFDSGSVRFAGRVATYNDGTNFVEDKIRVRLTTVTSSFDTNGYTIQFFRWNADGAGHTNLDSAALSFTIYYNSQPISSAMTSIDSATVTSLRTQYGIGTTSSDFFNRTTIVVSGVDNSWQVLKAVLYSGQTAIAQADVLMPLFLANPNSYATNHPAVLNSLHPFYANRTNGYTDAQWVQTSNQNCFY
jgi:hypothetical protein